MCCSRDVESLAQAAAECKYVLREQLRNRTGSDGSELMPRALRSLEKVPF